MIAETAPKAVVVVVDDNAHVLKAMRVLLSRTYEVHTVQDPELSVGVVAQVNPNVVILDVRMPRRDGFWVFAEIRKFNTRVPIIFNSAFQDAMAYQDVMASYNPFAYVAKGNDMIDLLQVVAAAVQESRKK